MADKGLILNDDRDMYIYQYNFLAKSEKKTINVIEKLQSKVQSSHYHWKLFPVISTRFFLYLYKYEMNSSYPESNATYALWNFQ